MNNFFQCRKNKYYEVNGYRFPAFFKVSSFVFNNRKKPIKALNKGWVNDFEEMKFISG